MNYAKANFEELSKYLGSIIWKETMQGKTVQERYEIFLDKHSEGVRSYVPVYRVEKSKDSWYNAMCVNIQMCI